jgi:hypothetical protein
VAGTKLKLTKTSQPIKGDDVAHKREKDVQIAELQAAVRVLLENQQNQNRR